MTTEIALTLTIIVAALMLFATEKLRVDLVALLVLLSVGLPRLIDPKEIFDGFANPAVITVWGGLYRDGLLIPLSFSSLLGGKMTLIGTPANILAMAILAERGLSTLGFFQFTPIGIVVLTTGVLYMVLVGRHLPSVRDGRGGTPGRFPPDRVALGSISTECANTRWVIRGAGSTGVRARVTPGPSLATSSSRSALPTWG